jgi:hypothetical protein
MYMRYRILKSAAILILPLFIISIIFNINAAAQDEECQACPGTDGGYTFQPISVLCSTSRVVTPNEEFEHMVILAHPGEYQASSISVELSLDSASKITLSSSSNELIRLPPMGSGNKVVKFNLKAGEPSQSQKLRTIIKYDANFHYEPTVYTEILDISITIDEILLEPDTWTVDIEKGSRTSITVKALEDVQNIRVIPSATLDDVAEVTYKVPKSLAQGRSFEIEIKAKSIGSGKLNFVYEGSDGQPHKLTMDIIVSEEFSREEDSWVQVGEVTGILSYAILILSAVVGVPYKKLKPAFNKIFKNALIRKEFHCGICYILVVLALFHAVVVMANHWNGIMIGSSFIFANPDMNYGWYINLGTISWFFMILVSVHNIITLSALIICTSHVAVMLHFRFL